MDALQDTIAEMKKIASSQFIESAETHCKALMKDSLDSAMQKIDSLKKQVEEMAVGYAVEQAARSQQDIQNARHNVWKMSQAVRQRYVIAVKGAEMVRAYLSMMMPKARVNQELIARLRHQTPNPSAVLLRRNNAQSSCDLSNAMKTVEMLQGKIQTSWGRVSDNFKDKKLERKHRDNAKQALESVIRLQLGDFDGTDIENRIREVDAEKSRLCAFQLELQQKIALGQQKFNLDLDAPTANHEVPKQPGDPLMASTPVSTAVNSAASSPAGEERLGKRTASIASIASIEESSTVSASKRQKTEAAGQD